MIVAITGASGFIGTHLYAAFRSAGHEVRPVARGDFASGGLERHLAGADVVVHAAGATRAHTLAGLRAANVDLTRQVALAARDAGVGRLLFVSSQAAAGPASSRDNPITEDDAPSPVEDYGRSKLDAESVVRDSGIPFTIVRPAAVYGPGDRDFLAMFRLARLGLAIHAANRDHWLSIVHAGDVARAIVLAAAAPQAMGATYFLANPEPVTWGALFRLAAAAAGTRIRLDVDVPYAAVAGAARIGDAITRMRSRPPLLSSRKIALARPHFWICSTDLAARELAFVPSIDLASGLAETHRWYAARGWL